jgi:hypothetical protein
MIQGLKISLRATLCTKCLKVYLDFDGHLTCCGTETQRLYTISEEVVGRYFLDQLDATENNNVKNDKVDYIKPASNEITMTENME